jgi:membrane fusion protein (multidrug efflux system)
VSAKPETPSQPHDGGNELVGRTDEPEMAAVAPNSDNPQSHHRQNEDLFSRDHPLTGTPNPSLGVVDSVRAFRNSMKWLHSLPLLGTGIRLFILLLVGSLVLLVAEEWDWWAGSAAAQSTDDAYLQADLTPLAAKSPGYVRKVLVGDFQKVKAGETLIEIVDDDYRAQLEQAQANVVAGEVAIDIIEQQKLLQQALVKQAEATIRATEADLIRYHLEALRQQRLLTISNGTPQITEQAVANENRTAATLELNRAQLDQQRRQLDVLESQSRQANATLKAQQAARDLTEINLGYTRITAPVDGMVGQRQVRPGQYVSIGTQVISVVPLPNVWVIANYKETQMTHVRIGQQARVTVDAFPGGVLHGHVDSWSPASGAQFSLLPPDNATGNFTKVVQRILVKIVLDHDPALDELLRPGMSVIATIDTTSIPPTSGGDAQQVAK